MAGFPPNLDDGEHWLPSDIFPDELSSKISPDFPSELTYMEDLAQQLAAYALLERNQNTVKSPPNLVPKLQSKQHSRYGTLPAPRTGLGFSSGGGHGVGHRQNHFAAVNDGIRVGFAHVYRYQSRGPAQYQLFENYLQARALLRLQNQNQNQNQNHFSPFQVSGRGMGGFVRESGGTGVFLPRVATTLDGKKKPGVKKWEEGKQRQPTKKAVVAVEKHERFQSSPELRLPQDWTY